MDNALRIKRVKEGIVTIKHGKDPYFMFKGGYDKYKDFLGISSLGFDILVLNGPVNPQDPEVVEMEKNGFIFNEMCSCGDTMLHNWKRFLELIEKL